MNEVESTTKEPESTTKDDEPGSSADNNAEPVSIIINAFLFNEYPEAHNSWSYYIF